MQGTSAFLEYIGPHGRKRKDACAYFIEGKCDYSKAQTYKYKCVGRMYCENFDDTDETRKKIVLDRKMKSKILKSNIHPLLNKTIKVEDIVTKKVFIVKIVKEHEASPGLYMFSQTSKIGRAFRTGKIGSVVEFNIYGEKYKLKIISIE